MKQTEILVKSTIDGSMQPSLFYKAKGENRPLLVGLHTWSHNRFNQVDRMVPYAEKYDFNLVLPEFRGANLGENPICTEACGSLLAKQDIKDVVDYIKNTEEVDEENIFLLGASGGGHMALMMAAVAPELFRAVASFVPITNLAKWYMENENYAPHVKACCGTKAEMLRRSPVLYMDGIAKANVKIFAGKYDPVVPVAHSEDFYYNMKKKYPDAKIYLDIFDGGHDMDYDLAAHFYYSQMNKPQTEKVQG
jgi:dipeptidyl aminopeptidase/acylaminoacyl peptidase